MKILPNIWLLKRGRDCNIAIFGIIDIKVLVAIVMVIVIVQFGGGRVCGCLLSQDIFQTRVQARMNKQLGISYMYYAVYLNV